MEYGICDLSVIPVRAEPSDKSEIITQLLFGETYKVTAKKADWLKVKASFDDYEGWIDKKQHYAINDKYYNQLQQEPVAVTLEVVQAAISSKRQVPILIGSSLPKYDGMNFKINKEKFVYNGQAVAPGNHINYEKVIEKCALKYLNAPYLWGGRSPFGIDCSGFTQVVFKILGILIKRDSYQQSEQGKQIDFVDHAKEGDLAFFENKEGRITHVGIVLKGKKIIHASGKVRIDKLDQFGIYNEETKKYSHKLKMIKRLL